MNEDLLLNLCICTKGEGEFSSRQQRFKAPTPLNSPGRLTPCTRNLSSFVHGIQQQLNTTVTPSSKEVSRIRQVCFLRPCFQSDFNLTGTTGFG